MQNRSLGVLVFPTHRSDIILGNPSLLHYGCYGRSNSSNSRKLDPEEQNRDSRDSSNPTNDISSFYLHSSNTVLINTTEKLNQSMESNHLYSKSNINQQNTENGEKKERNLLEEQQKALICEANDKPSKKSTESKMTSAENDSIEWKLSNSSEGSELAKVPEMRITSKPQNAFSEIEKNSYASKVQSNFQQDNFICNSKSFSPSDAMQVKQKLIEPIIQRQSSADIEQHMNNNIRQRHNADGIVKEILDDLDNALDSDEHMSFNEMRQNSQKIASLSGYPWDNSKYSCTYENDNSVRSAYKSKDNKREYEIKSNKIKTTISISDHLNKQLIQELKQLPQGMTSLKDYKQKQKNLIIEQEKLLEIDIEEMKKACISDKYISQVPEFVSGTTKLLPSWKRQILAQKIATEDMQRKEEELRRKFQEWKSQFYPMRHKPKV